MVNHWIMYVLWRTVRKKNDRFSSGGFLNPVTHYSDWMFSYCHPVFSGVGWFSRSMETLSICPHMLCFSRRNIHQPMHVPKSCTVFWWRPQTVRFTLLYVIIFQLCQKQKSTSLLVILDKCSFHRPILPKSAWCTEFVGSEFGWHENKTICVHRWWRSCSGSANGHIGQSQSHSPSNWTSQDLSK